MIKKITILSTQCLSDRTGVRVYCDSLEQELKKRGMQVVRLTYHDCTNVAWHRLIWCVRLSRLAGRGVQQVILRLMMYLCGISCLKSQKVEGVVLAQDPIMGAAANAMGLKTITTCHFSDPIKEVLRANVMPKCVQWALRLLMRWFLIRNPRYIVLTQKIADVMGEYAPNAEITLIPTICRFDHFLTPLPHKEFRIVMAGRLENLKGQERLVKMMAHMKDPSVSLWLLGDGPDKRNLVELATKLGVADRVKFLGYVLCPEEIYRQCDLYIHSSRMECMPLTPIEAIFCGIPAWCYEFPGYNDFGMFNNTPHLFDSTSAEELSDYVKVYVESGSSELLEQQRDIVKQFMPRHAVERILSLCQG